ncbi:CPBP family intramembrane glutamic endopeptidase [Natrinema salaciae]|uniref:Membrane protease YdiL, CAAX protease family n=1 Tax=Natrinema salaciae TaxID=1186196 RepID=A0A1H9QLM0_9EURY|nr:CPBP family intramembrane glutamic endopeptidase [Natrinema salaciae]SER61307.1 Membrane protease YdiL, CAAX protease family [Natrinema salaciae]
MPQWATFVGITGVVLVLLLVLSHLTQSAFSDGDPDPNSDSDSDPDPGDGNSESSDGASAPTDAPADADRVDIAIDLPPRNRPTERTQRTRTDFDPTTDTPTSDESSAPRPASSAADPDGSASDSSRHPNAAAADGDRERPADRGIDPDSLSTGVLLANVAFSQGLFALVLIGAAIYAAIPASALGIELSAAFLETGLLWGTAAGVAFYVANELAAAAATRVGFDHEEDLRELLSPDSLREWLMLLAGVLPIIAVFEELLFRAALIGVPAAGFGLSPWLLAIGSSIAFALGHGMQGSVGVVVTGALGFALAAVFIVTGSLLVVVVAHYLVNALEFVVHEGLGLDWAETLES